jgi:hypothetical protein
VKAYEERQTFLLDALKSGNDQIVYLGFVMFMNNKIWMYMSNKIKKNKKIKVRIKIKNK